VLVMCVAAVCGGLWVTTASAVGAVVATVQAEQMTLPAGATVITSSGASGGQAVSMTQPGTSLTGTVSLPAAATSIQVVAEGTRCRQGWPTLAAAVDGTTVLSGVSVNSSSWRSYGATVALAAGTHSLSITDSAANSCRTLYVDAVVFSGAAAVAPTVSLSAAPSSVASGSASSLTWTSANATGCTASGGWSGSEPTSGSASTGALTATTQYVLTCSGPGGNASASTTVTVTDPPAPAAGKACQSVAIPAYFYPSGGGGLWSTAVAAEPGIGIMIANVDNGPGSAVDSDYAAAISRARSAGIQVYGYVYTSYGSRARATVESDIAAWDRFYGVTDIFLDEASTTGSTLSYYQALTAYVHQEAAGSLTIVNFGTIPPQSQMSAGDIAVTFEGSYSTYQGIRFPSWVNSFPASRFYNIIYGVPSQTSMSQVVSEAAANHVAYVYATSLGLPNPYDGLPSYLTAEASLAHSGC
jgi:Spherulation-specific family 4